MGRHHPTGVRRICRHCWTPEEDHCHFMPFTQPHGCVCDQGTWGRDIPPACEAYVGDGTHHCAKCEHDKACHKEKRDGE